MAVGRLNELTKNAANEDSNSTLSITIKATDGLRSFVSSDARDFE
jgi:hypothetical protein